MRPNLTLLCAVVAMASLLMAARPSTPTPQAEAESKRQVLDVNQRWADAETKHDAATVRRILDDKFIATFGTNPPHGKEAFVNTLMGSDIDPTERQTLTDETVVVDGDTAVLVGTDTLRGTKNGAAYTITGRYTVTYIRRHGQWLALAEHLVAAPNAK